MWDINQLALNKYEEFYNQALVLTCISMKPSILFVGHRADLGSYTFNFAPTKRTTVLALSTTTCEQVGVSPETAMGCCRIRFLQVKEGYYYTFSLNKE